MSKLPLSEDAQYVVNTLFSELEEKYREWSQEYKQDRDLGLRGEFVGLYRKTRKLKTVIWDGADPSRWREGIRTILLEVAAHALLAVKDYDDEHGEVEKKFGQAVSKYEAAGYTSCTSATRPIVTIPHSKVYEIDTRQVMEWTGSNWVRCPIKDEV